MTNKNLTDRTIKSLKAAPVGKHHDVWDVVVPGLGVRISSTGRKTFVLMVRYPGKSNPTRRALGAYDPMSLGRARDKAREWLNLISRGIDPSKAADPIAAEDRATRKALTFLKRGIEPACYLYRHYHPDGDLLYVGISLAPLHRQDGHTKQAPWRNMICRILIEPFETREEALAAEELAIRTEFPKFNSIHNRRHPPVQELRQFSEQTETKSQESCQNVAF